MSQLCGHFFLNAYVIRPILDFRLEAEFNAQHACEHEKGVGADIEAEPKKSISDINLSQKRISLDCGSYFTFDRLAG